MFRLLPTSVILFCCFTAFAQIPVLEPKDVYLVRERKPIHPGESMTSVIKKWGKPTKTEKGYSHTEDTEVYDLFYGKNKISFWWGGLSFFEIHDSSILVSKRGYRIGMTLIPNSDNANLYNVNFADGTVRKLQVIINENKKVIRIESFPSH